MFWLSVALASPPHVEITEAHRAAAAATVVHEWGTFTSSHGPDGAPLEWRVLQGGEPLPDFVHHRGDADALRDAVGRIPTGPPGTKSGWATVRMETPVLYFHAPAPTRLHVRVGYPSGTLTEWYPAARELGSGGLDWGWVGIEPSAPDPLPHRGSANHYYEARKVRAATVRVDDEVERFLFYRGIGGDLPDVRPTSTAEEVRWDGRGARALVVYEHTDRRRGAVRLDRAGAVTRASLTDPDPRALLREALLAEGLFADEVEAMLATWERDWFGPGLRAFYVLPTPVVDRYLPLSIEPAPARTVRVLVGRAELLPPDLVQLARATVQGEPSDAHERILTDRFGRIGSALSGLFDAER